MHPLLLALASLAAAAFFANGAASADPLADLGQALFFDASLSSGGVQSCATCHDPANGFTAPLVNGSPFPQGAVAGQFGKRKPPSLAYGALAPVLHHLAGDDGVLFTGGDFADGRATGQGTGNPASEQALAPFLNPDEMALPDAATLASRACATQGDRIEALRAGECAKGAEGAEAVVATLGQALAAFEASPAVARFSSRFDTAELTAAEQRGLVLFDTKAGCAACHVRTAGPQGEPALFTDFSYDNIGVPRNRINPWYADPANPQGTGWADPGLGATLAADPLYAAFAAENTGRFKVPTLRNLSTGQDRAYMHNGWFRSLEAVVHFYNTRDILPRCADPLASQRQALALGCWPAPETAQGVNRDELGNLHLTPAEEADLTSFLRSLTDP